MVYRARDLRHNRPVAIKVLRSGYSEAVGAERFLREIETAARLQHPHILPIYDSGQAAGELYCVMPFVDGESLRERLEREGQLPQRIALRFGLEVAEALSYAHSLGVVHRDIKPENILLFREHAMVADFGIAKIRDVPDAANLTLEGAGMGTPAYMSPEQAFDEPGVDGRSDEYSLACVIYEMLEGTLPFTGRSGMQILAEKAQGTLRPFAQPTDDVPLHVVDAVMRALSRHADERFAGVDEFAHALSTVTASSLPARRRTTAHLERSLAVLPFENATGAPEDEYLGDGIAEELMHALSRFPGLRVVARTSAFALKGRQTDARTVGTTLGVKSFLSGTVRRAGHRLRITADLTDVETGFATWSERYDREMADVFDVQDDIARAIVAALKVTLLGDDARVTSPADGRTGREKRFVAAPTDSLEAWEDYLRGRFHWNQRTTQGMRESMVHLHGAVERDPEFVLAHAGLADALVTMAIYGVMSPNDAMPAALTAAERALAIDPHSAEALTARASARSLYAYDHVSAERDYIAAIKSREQYATAHQWFAMHLLGPQGRFAEGRARLARARELDPISPAIATSGAILRFYERDFEQAIAETRQVLERHPAFGLAEYFLGLAYTATGHVTEALDVLNGATFRTGRNAEVVSALACAMVAAGDDAGARALLAQLETRSHTEYISPAHLALVQAALGDHARALAELDRAAVFRATEMPFAVMRIAFDPLRTEPRFIRMVEQATGHRG